MTRFEPGPGTRNRAGKRLAGVSLAAIAALASACVAGPITVDASDAAALTRATTVHVTVLPDAGGPAGSVGAGSGTAASGTAASDTTPPRAAADEVLLRAEAENTLRARGYVIGGEADSELILEIGHRIELESVRTWSSDPDASGPRQVEREAGVLTLRALDRESGLEVWTCDARGLLPKAGLFFEADAQTVWSQILAQALSRVPARS